MATFTEVSYVSQIDIASNGGIGVRTTTDVLKDGTVISSSYHRHVVTPGQDYSNEDARVKAICAATHTAEVIAAYQAAIEAQQAAMAQRGA